MQAVLDASFLPRLSSLRLRTPLAAIAATLALAACSTTVGGGEPAAITGDSVEEINWTDVRTAELETEVAQLKAKNAELEKQLASLRKANAETDGKAAAAAAEAPATGEPGGAPVNANAVIAAAEADRALADAPANPVQPSPRLVQPSFASGQETVFENEAKSAIKMTSVLYGVHLASYRTEEDAKAGWRKLQRDNPDELGLLEPRVEPIAIEDRGDFIRLIGGGFSARNKAEALCATLKAKGLFCAVTSFGGERLSFADPPSN